MGEMVKGHGVSDEWEALGRRIDLAAMLDSEVKDNEGLTIRLLRAGMLTLEDLEWDASPSPVEASPPQYINTENKGLLERTRTALVEYFSSLGEFEAAEAVAQANKDTVFTIHMELSNMATAGKELEQDDIVQLANPKRT